MVSIFFIKYSGNNHLGKCVSNKHHYSLRFMLKFQWSWMVTDMISSIINVHLMSPGHSNMKECYSQYPYITKFTIKCLLLILSSNQVIATPDVRGGVRLCGLALESSPVRELIDWLIHWFIAWLGAIILTCFNTYMFIYHQYMQLWYLVVLTDIPFL